MEGLKYLLGLTSAQARQGLLSFLTKSLARKLWKSTLDRIHPKIGQRTKSAPVHRFWGLHVHIMKLDTLEAANLEARWH
jgi:hypothetical protein